MKFVETYIHRYNTMVKGVKGLNPTTEEDVIKLHEQVNQLILLNYYTDDITLHNALVHVTDMFVNIINKKKYKPKHIENYNTAINYLDLYHQAHASALGKLSIEGIDVKAEKTLWQNETYVRKTIQTYCEQMIMKLVDQLPAVPDKSKQLQPIVELFDEFTFKMNEMIALGLSDWVLLYTTNPHRLNIALNSLNAVSKLGDIITKWMDDTEENSTVKFFRENGYHVMGKWGNGKTVVNLPKTKDVMTVESTNGTFTKEECKEIVRKMYHHSFMFVRNKRFNILDGQHRAAFFLTLASCSHVIKPNDVMSYQVGKILFDSLLMMLKDLPAFRARKDAKRWLSAEQISEYINYHNKLINNKTLVASIVIATHTYDMLLTEPNLSFDEQDDVYEASRSVFGRIHNTIYYSENPWTKDDIINLMYYAREEVFPKYRGLVDTRTDKGFDIWTIITGYVINFKENNRIKWVYECLKEQFNTRHTKEEWEKWIVDNQPYLMFESPENKRVLAKMLEENPLTTAKSGQAKNIQDTIIQLYTLDKYFPIDKGRKTSLDIHVGYTEVNMDAGETRFGFTEDEDNPRVISRERVEK